MKNIVIKELKDNAYQYLIFSTTVDSPFFQIDEIIKAIKCSKKVVVIFDQLLQTGDTDNRFISFELDKSLNYNSAKIINENLEPLKKEISNFLYKNQQLMDFSILLSEQKDIIKKGGIV